MIEGTPKRRWSSRVGLLGSGFVFGFLILALVTAGEIYEYQDTVDGVHLPEVDAVVCLAGGRGRIATAGDLWFRYFERAGRGGKPPIFYLSGLGHQANWGVFAKQLRRGVKDVIHPEDVVLENESNNTEENARWLKRYAQAHQWGRIILVTSSYHMKRAKFIFDRVLGGHFGDKPIAVETLSVYQDPFEPGEWRGGLQGIRVTVWEYLKWLYYKSIWNKAG